MIQEATAAVVQRDFSQLLNKVHYQHEQVIITEAGKPVAALVDISLFERIFQSMSNEMASAFADCDENEIEALLNEAKQA